MKFDSAVATYDRWAVHQAEASETLFTLPALPLAPESLIDLGCGTGLTSQAAWLRWPHIELTGLDASDAMLAAYQQRFPQAKTLRGDLLTFEPIEKYELAVSSFVFQWVSNSVTLFSRLAGFLRPHGRLVFAEPLAGSLPEFDAACAACGLSKLGLNFRTAETIREALEIAGYKVLSSEVRECSHRYADAMQALKVFQQIGALPFRRPLGVGETRRLLKAMQPSLTYQVGYFVAEHE